MKNMKNWAALQLFPRLMTIWQQVEARPCPLQTSGSPTHINGRTNTDQQWWNDELWCPLSGRADSSPAVDRPIIVYKCIPPMVGYFISPICSLIYLNPCKCFSMAEWIHSLVNGIIIRLKVRFSLIAATSHIGLYGLCCGEKTEKMNVLDLTV